MPPQPAHEFLRAGQSVVFAILDQFHDHLALAGHQVQQLLRLQRDFAILEQMPERAAIVEADQLAIVFLLGKLDALRFENLVKGVEMQRLAVHDHAVEIQKHGKGPFDHCEMIIWLGPRWQSYAS